MEDGEIIDLFWARDDRALAAAGAAYGGRLLGLAERLLGSRQDAEECVNDTYLAAWDTIPPARPDHLFAYLARLCRNRACNRIDWQRAQKRRTEIVALTAELEACVPDRRRETAAETADLGELLTTFLRRQPEIQRQVFLRRYWYADSIRDIARRYGFGESKVKTMLLRTRQRLRTYLEGEGIRL